MGLVRIRIFPTSPRVRPAIAFIIDIRRDNLLLHLLFKALFEEAHTRIEYLAMLFGRPVPPDLESWRGAPVTRLTDTSDTRVGSEGSGRPAFPS